MKVVIQRVTTATVSQQGASSISTIGPGMLILLGIATGDTPEQALQLCRKIASLRIFEDSPGAGNMNRSLNDNQDLQIMVVSQFTLQASTKKGNRPSFLNAANAQIAQPLYNLFCSTLSQIANRPTAQGLFGANMAIELTNDGPVTIIMDTDEPI